MEVNKVADFGKKKRKGEEIEALKDDGTGETEVIQVGEKQKSLNSEVEMVVSKEGCDDEDTLLKTVFVANLPLKVKTMALLEEFSQFGEVDCIRIRSLPIIIVGNQGKVS